MIYNFSINCQPICDPPCENAKCQHPNQCICNPGYIIDLNNVNTCILPPPNNDSIYSNCPITPNCEDIVINESLNDTTNIFAPKGDHDCPLHVKEQCCNNIHNKKTDSGNENVDSYFSNNTDTNEGVVKENSTPNPNNSEIIVGRGSPFDYYEGPPNEPFCTDECNNCKCVADETWVCEPGWYLNEDQTECLPHCDACIHGVCKAPYICECFEGYHLSKLSTTECIPDCNCTKGCLIPNICIFSKCETCENKCSNETVFVKNVGVIKHEVVEGRTIEKSTNAFQDNRTFDDPVEINVISQKKFKNNQIKSETMLSGIP